jgi:hypothetical protein
MTQDAMTVDEQTLLDTALRRLSEAELQPVVTDDRPSPDADFDPVFRVNAPVGTELYDVQLKTMVSRSSAGAIHHKGARRLLVVSQHVSDAVAEVWRDRDIHFVDSAGNMYLRWPKLLVDVRGRRGQPSARPTRVGQPLRAFESSGLRRDSATPRDAAAGSGGQPAITDGPPSSAEAVRVSRPGGSPGG